jgi:hypothetical protein
MKTDLETEKLISNLTSVRRFKDKSVRFKCILAPNSAEARRIQWKFSQDGENYGALPAGVQNITYDEILIEHVNKTHRGYYSCRLNGISFAALLRVRGLFNPID